MRLTVVGPAPAWTRRAGRPASSAYLLETDGEALLLDMGQGSFAALGTRLAPERLRAVLVSHLHVDHHADLVPLRHYLKFGLPEPATIELHAPAEMRPRYDAFLGEPDFLAALPGPALVAGERRIGPFAVTVARVTHTDDSFGFRVAPAADPAAPGLVYSGDCGRAADLLPLLRPGDTLLCEAAWGRGEPIAAVNHLTAAEAAWAAREGRAARLVLTHLLDATAAGSRRAARRVFAGEVLVARPGLTVEVG